MKKNKKLLALEDTCSKMILIDGAYINNSGGKILLEYLIQFILDENIQDSFFFIFDNRLNSEWISKINANNWVSIKGSERERKKVYRLYAGNFNTVFCFANVPPPVKLIRERVYIFFHNALLLENKLSNYTIFQRFIFDLKRSYIRFKNFKNYVWIVQTKHIKNDLEKVAINGQQILVLPIYDIDSFLNVNQQLPENDNNFLYIADGVTQKNHVVLLEAWETLFDRHQIHFNLHLTVPGKYGMLINEIDRLNKKGLNIINNGICSKEHIISLYEKCNHFVMPSLTESFGLPIVEAASAGCNIIAADLQYVYDIIEPSASFNPQDPEDLVRAIISFGEKKRATKVIIKNEIKTLMNLLTKNV